MTIGGYLMVAFLAAAPGTSALAQLYTISTATDTFVPSYRAEEGSSYFGWAPGTFDGGANDELMENPPPTLGSAPGTLDQVGTADILAGNNSIYIGAAGRSETLSLAIPTAGVPGEDGFTTIIIQGLTLVGGPPANTIVNYPIFGAIDGLLPAFVIGVNANAPGQGQGQGQWWAKYELPGNSDVYSLSISLGNVGGQTVPLTISKLEVDTFYSTTGFAADDAQAIPEPSTWALCIGAVAMLMVSAKTRTAFRTLFSVGAPR